MAADRLWLCLQFPALAVEVFTLQLRSPPPCVVRVGEGGTQRVYACNEGARALGVRAGMRVGAAHALGAIEVFARRVDLERQALEALAVWGGQFSSLVSLEPPAALLVEIGGSLRLFGGARALRDAVKREAAGLGHQVRMAGAPAPLAALWLARAGERRLVADPARLPGALARLPLTVLELPPKTARSLAGMGVASVGELARLPRKGLAQRLGPQLLELLDRGLGRRPDPRRPFAMPARFERHLELPAPLPGGEGLAFALERLLHELVAYLRATGGGVQRFRFLLGHERAPATPLEIGLLAPAREHRRLALVLRERLERLRLPAPVAAVTLCAGEIAALGGDSEDLFGDLPEALPGRSRDLIERLRARLGAEAVTGLDLAADHRPERAGCETVITGEAGALARRPLYEGRGQRPLWLLPEPVPLAERAGRPLCNGALKLGERCERLQSGWWDGGGVQRDYFLAEDEAGLRLWVYRDIAARRWFLHGIFD